MEKNSKLHIGWLVTAMMVVLLIIDQIIKLYIKTHFALASLFVLQIGFYRVHREQWYGLGHDVYRQVLAEYAAPHRHLCSVVVFVPHHQVGKASEAVYHPGSSGHNRSHW